MLAAFLFGVHHERNDVENSQLFHLMEYLHLYVADKWWYRAVYLLRWPNRTEDEQTAGAQLPK